MAEESHVLFTCMGLAKQAIWKERD